MRFVNRLNKFDWDEFFIRFLDAWDTATYGEFASVSRMEDMLREPPLEEKKGGQGPLKSTTGSLSIHRLT